MISHEIQTNKHQYIEHKRGNKVYLVKFPLTYCIQDFFKTGLTRMVVSSTDFPGEVERDRFRISESLGLVLSPVDTSTSCRAFIFCRRLSIVPSDCIRALSMASACRLICSCNWCCEQQTMPDYHEKVLNVYLYDMYILLLCSILIPASLLLITDSMPFF